MISAPDNYGLSRQATLDYVGSTDPPEHFDDFWADFREELCTIRPRLTGSFHDTINPVAYESMHSIPIVARVSMPTGPVLAVFVTSHGYANVPATIDGDDEPLISRGFAVMRIRVRGYPPSVEGIGDLRQSWILHHIEKPEAWILRGAIGDLAQACRCARAHFGMHVPIMLHGESFGAGLAIHAAAQLAALGEPVDRLAIGLPTFGDWRWRAAHYCGGSGGQINALIEAFREEADAFIAQLCLYDAVLHARAIHAPTLCKLALRDDIVPAPTAAAIFNAIPVDSKWRFVVPCGHYDAGLSNARRHLQFEQLLMSFVDPHRDPISAIDASDAPLETS